MCHVHFVVVTAPDPESEIVHFQKLTKWVQLLAQKLTETLFIWPWKFQASETVIREVPSEPLCAKP